MCIVWKEKDCWLIYYSTKECLKEFTGSEVLGRFLTRMTTNGFAYKGQAQIVEFFDKAIVNLSKSINQ